MNLFYKLVDVNFFRRRLLAKTNADVMKCFLTEAFPTPKTLISEIDIVSLDIETTGLNPNSDKIVSIGLVTIDSLGIELSSSWHQILQAKQQLQEPNVAIHQITDDQTKAGMDIEQALPLLLENLKGKVLLAHNANVEHGFLNQACLALYQTKFAMPIIDTQVLAKRVFDRQGAVYKNTDLRLFNLRQYYNMPVYKAHNALMDAIATAELFLAIVNDNYPNNNARLKDVLT